MTALAGAWPLREHRALDLCRRILAAQAAYGESAPRTWNDDMVALGSRLTPSLPEDRYDRGPIALADGGALLADARVDNREDLAPMLSLSPAQASGTSDAALVALAWERWGDTLLDRVIGDLAFVAWDARARRLTLARDAFGRRPLHYHAAAGLFAFASMPTGLRALPNTPLGLDERRLASFLALGPELGGASFFEGIERVEPGCMVIVDSDGVRARRWYAPPRRPIRLGGPHAYAEALREQLDRAVAARLRRAGGPIGSHLSSGWDSAAVTATAARLARASDGRVIAFTASPRFDYAGPVPRGRTGDESGGAADVAAAYGNIDHLVVRGEAVSPLEGLDRHGALLGRPVLNPCNQVVFDEICRRARARGVRVMLTGDFGNEGLTDDGVDWLADLTAAGHWVRWIGVAVQALAAGSMSLGGVIGVSFGGDGQGPIWRWLSARRGAWAGPPGAFSALPPARWREAHRPLVGADGFERRLGLATVLDDGPVLKAMLAAFGVDHRAPLMDRRLVEFCLNVPRGQIFRQGRPRALARAALADRLPASVLARTTSGLQSADWHEGLTAARSEARAELERLARTPLAARLLDLPRLSRLVEDWPQGGWTHRRVITEYRLALLRGLSVGRFVRTTLGSNA